MSVLRKSVTVVIIIAIALIAFESFLALKQKQLVDEHCKTFGITERRACVADKLGIKTSVNGRWYRELRLNPPATFPIGTFPNATVIGFKEGDGHDWPIHKTDRFGYFNEDRWWDAPEVLLMGDSFVTCEHLQTNSITAILRARGVPAINIGLTGTGPILQLAALKTQWRYLSNSVTHIVWVLYDGNDYQDAVEENEVEEYRLILNGSWQHTPDPRLLDRLEQDDQRLYSKAYAVRSVLSLKRTRLVLRRMTGVDAGVQIWNRCIEEAARLCGNITVVRIRKIGLHLNNHWNRIEAPDKTQLPMVAKYYSKSMILAHLNHDGYEALATIIQERLYAND